MPTYGQALERLRNTVNITEVIGQYISLRRSGKNLVGLCPFHQEKTPSFSVSPDNGLFYCFGCHAGGDVIAFLMRIENLPFDEAVETLAVKAGIALPERSEGAAEAREKKDQFWQICEKACAFYENMLLSPEGTGVRAYLAHRGLKEQIWRQFRLGFAPEGNKLVAHLRPTHPLGLLVKTGLATEREGGADIFHGRLMFPIMDLRGRPIAFGGRAIDDHTQPKYLNTGQTPIFEKGQNLYGLHVAKRHIMERRSAIVVEGYMDLLSCHQFGFTHAVASLGTALTPDQVKLLARFSQRVTLAYDADLAGVRATLRSVELFRTAEIEVQVAAMEGHKDPDSLLQAEGSEPFSRALGRTLPAAEFAYHKIAQSHDWQVPEEKRAAVMEILAMISSLDNLLEQEQHIKRLALDAGLGEEILFQQMKQIKGPLQKTKPARKSVSIDEAQKAARTIPAAEEQLLQMVLAQPSLLADLEPLRPADLRHPGCQRILTEALASWQEGKSKPTLSSEDPELLALFSRLLLSGREVIDPLAEARQCWDRIQREKMKQELKRLKEEMKQLEQTGQNDALQQKLLQYRELVNKSRSKLVKEEEN